MSLNETFESTNARSELLASPSPSLFRNLMAKAVWLQGALSPLGIASIVGGISLACFGAIFAVQQGVSAALALMAAYCVVTSCIACTVTLALLSQRTPKVAVVTPARELRPNIAAWRLVSELRVSDACRLWCDIEPGAPYSQEAIAWATAMIDAIKKGELPLLPRQGLTRELDERERTNPTWRTRISRDDLKAWASSHGYCPPFLAS